MPSRYLIGIDLGTTNSAIAYVDGKARGKPRLQTLHVPQLVHAGSVAEKSLLPSFLYLPGEHDLPPGACALPWDKDCRYAVGEFARQYGAKVPGRLVSSAKSWLCHAGVDRTATILPWSAPPEVQRLSPIEASARYLRHLAEAWNHLMARDKPDDQLEEQQVVLTVPASFDDVARNLTVDAAHQAGIKNLILLEEPQAAFYCWLALAEGCRVDKREQVRPVSKEQLKPGTVCLVVDVGGGTSDFSLIQATEDQGDLGFVRQAVGDHLLLGGDNMDLALARHVEAKLPQAGRLDAPTLSALVQACREAKEVLLAPNPPAQHTVTVMGRGRMVVGGAMHAILTPIEVRMVLFNGFFPEVSVDAIPARAGRVGLHEMGLPYVNDPAVTRHLAAFLHQHGMDKDRPPEAILFNGGVFQPEALRQRLITVMKAWYDRPDRSWNPVVLSSPSLDLAVAWGAAYYGWLRQTGGKRIMGGLARSYYLGVQGAPGDGMEGGLDLLCVVPQHLEDGQEITLDKPDLELALGQPVTFPLYSSTVRGDDKPGQTLRLSPQQLLRLPPLHTILRGGKRSGTKNVPVHLAARLTEIGTLELWCVAREGENRWRLEFNVREILTEGNEQPGADAPGAREAVGDVWPEEKVQAAAHAIRSVYASRNEDDARNLTKTLETVLEAPRHEWPTSLCRRLWDFLAEAVDQRRHSPAHLSRWYNLVGYCLRPGFGDPLDRFRVEQLWKILHSPARQGAGTAPATSSSAKVGEGGADLWICWRRVAGGLNPSLQQALLDRMRPILIPAKSGKGVPYRPGANELAEMWRAAASLERIDVRWKEQLGQALLKPLRRSPVPTYGFWALTRLGSRRLLYGPLNAIVHPHVVEQWIENILPFQPGNDNERQTWMFCLSQLAFRSRQLALDVNDEVRHKVVATLRAADASPRLVRMVEEGGELDVGEQKQFFGESLPIGLRLVAGEN